jgi:hypothetical protein
VTQPVEVSVPPELLERILALADNGMILIGGQALAFWAAYYETPHADWMAERCFHANAI